MKKYTKGRFIRNNSIEFQLPSISFIIKYFSILILLLPWIYTAKYKLNIGKIIEGWLFFLFGEPESIEGGKKEKGPY